MEIKKEYYSKVAETVIKNLKNRNMDAYYCDNKEEAVKKMLEIMEEGKSVTWGGTMTMAELGIVSELEKRNFVLLDRAKAKNREEVEKIYRDAFNADYYLMSSNAVTMQGELINIDGNGNRVAALIYGPKQVIIVVGMNKIVKDVESGEQRIKSIAAPMNTMRLNCDTPCAKTGVCHDCLGKNTICCTTVVTRYARHTDRIKVILVGEELGY
ncbi:MAG: lactate utilization protein [Firmicutes bacterium]|nr:lactate utilization protein [Bacillota bacterium]